MLTLTDLLVRPKMYLQKNEDIFKILLVHNKHMGALKNAHLYYALGSI